MTTETVELPSGRKVEIRKPGPRGMALILGALPTSALLNGDGDDPGDDLTDEQQKQKNIERFREMSRADRADAADSQMTVVCACSHAPRFTTAVPAPKGYTDIDDLEYADYVALRDKCLELIADSRQEATEKVGPLSETPTA